MKLFQLLFAEHCEFKTNKFGGWRSVFSVYNIVANGAGEADLQHSEASVKPCIEIVLGKASGFEAIP
jgi:hypothetical protein